MKSLCRSSGLVAVMAITGALAAQENAPRGQRPRPNNDRRQQTQAAIRQTEPQVVAAQQAVASAIAEVTVHQTAVAQAQGALEAASEASKTARSEVEAASQRVREIEQQADESQPKDSAYARAKAAFAQAKSALERDQARVFQSAEYQSQLQAVSSAADKSQKLPKLKEETLKKDLAYQRTRIEFDEVRAIYDRERNMLLEGNSEWVEASKSAAAARSEQTKAEQQAQASAARKAHANLKLRDAQKVVAAAQGNVQQLTAKLHSLQASIGLKQSTPGAEGDSKRKGKGKR